MIQTLQPQGNHPRPSTCSATIPLAMNTVFDIPGGVEYGSISGGRALFTSDINAVNQYASENFTASDMYLEIDTNAEACSNQTLTFMVNQVDTCITLTVAATQTGTFSCTCNTHAVKAGQEFIVHYDPLTTTANWRATGLGLKTCPVMMHGIGSFAKDVTTGTVQYHPGWSGECDQNTIENFQQTVVDTADTIHKLTTSITANTNTSGVFYLRTRICGADGSYFLAVGPGQTGRMTQLYGSQSLAATEIWNWQMDNADGNGTVSVKGINYVSKDGISQVGVTYQRTVVASTRHGPWIGGHNSMQGLARRRVNALAVATTVDAMTVEIPINNSTVQASVQIRRESTGACDCPIILFCACQTGTFRNTCDSISIPVGEEVVVRAVFGDVDYTIASACLLLK